jgi:hypothetical protein
VGASAGGFRLVEGDYHDVVIVVHGTSQLPGCGKETTYRNCATNGGLLRADSGQTPPSVLRATLILRDFGSSVDECLAAIDEVRVRYTVLRHQMVHRYP